MTTPPPSDQTRVRRGPKLARYDLTTVREILDDADLAYVAQVVEGRPLVIPTLFWRDGEEIFWHGSSKGRLQRGAAGGFPVCISVVRTDGWVLARSAFHHTLNYRSVTLFGEARPVTDADEVLRQLERFMERRLPGRWAQVRPPSRKELKATRLLRLPIREASVKLRSGGPKDDPDDLDWPVWAGVLPVREVVEGAVPDSGVAPGQAPPRYRTD